MARFFGFPHPCTLALCKKRSEQPLKALWIRLKTEAKATFLNVDACSPAHGLRLGIGFTLLHVLANVQNLKFDVRGIERFFIPGCLDASARPEKRTSGGWCPVRGSLKTEREPGF